VQHLAARGYRELRDLIPRNRWRWKGSMPAGWHSTDCWIPFRISGRGAACDRLSMHL